MKTEHERKWKIVSRHKTWPEADKARKALVKKSKFVQGDTVKVHRHSDNFVVKTASETRSEAIAKIKKAPAKSSEK